MEALSYDWSFDSGTPLCSAPTPVGVAPSLAKSTASSSCPPAHSTGFQMPPVLKPNLPPTSPVSGHPVPRRWLVETGPRYSTITFFQAIGPKTAEDLASIPIASLRGSSVVA